MFMLTSTHDRITAQLREDLAYWRAEATAALHREREATLRLLDKPEVPTIAPRVKREPDQVDTAIDWRAQGDPALRRHLERYAKGRRRDHAEPADIAAEIMQGDTTAEDEDGLP